MKIKLGILAAHPIQYYAPLFRRLARIQNLDLTVFYGHRPTPAQQGIGFGVSFHWDVDLTEGYPHVWLNNRSKRPGLQNFNGCDTPEISGIIHQEQFDAFLVLGWNTKSMWQAIQACWQTETPLMVRGDSHLRASMFPPKRFIKKLVYPFFIKRFACCLAVGKWSSEYFAHYGARRIILSPHFVDNDWFSHQADQSRFHTDEIRQRWNIPLRSTVFLFAGKFEDKKRPLDFLRAFKKVFQAGTPLYGLMAGDGILRSRCENFVRKNALPVFFAGFLNQTEIPKAYAAANVLVLPSDGRETWGLVVNEAMACGVPAIVSDQAGCSPDLIRSGETGFTFPCGDIDFLADRMRQAAIPSANRTMGAAARKYIAGYSVERAASGMMEAVEACKK